MSAQLTQCDAPASGLPARPFVPALSLALDAVILEIDERGRTAELVAIKRAVERAIWGDDDALAAREQPPAPPAPPSEREGEQHP